MVIGTFLVISRATAVIKGVRLGGPGRSVAGGAAIGAAAAHGSELGMEQGLGLDADEALRPVNQRLEAVGQPDPGRAARGRHDGRHPAWGHRGRHRPRPPRHLDSA